MARSFCVFRLMYRSITIAFVGLAIGAVHSARVPVALKVADESRVTQVQLPPANATNAANPSPTDPEVDPGTTTPDPTNTGDPTAGDVIEVGFEITIAQARQLFDTGLAQFIDARTPAEYQAGHVLGAFFVNAQSFEGGKSPESVQYLDPSQHLIIYCVGGDCDASHNTAVLLEQLGFENLHIMNDGYPAWVAAGYETEVGPGPFEGDLQ